MNKNLLALSVAAAALVTTASAAVSSNIVGYVKLNLKVGQNLVTNPLNNTASNGNKISTLFAPIGGGTVYRWAGTTFTSTEFFNGTIAEGEDFDLLPGEAVFVNVDAAVTITTVGDALVGLQTVSISAGNDFIGSKIPIGGPVSTLGYVPAAGSSIYKWNGTGYDTYDSFNGAWPDGEPSIDVGQGFVTGSATSFEWTKTFTVE